MFCTSESAVDVGSEREEIRRLKDGEILKYTSGFFCSKWKKVHAVLYSDSSFSWFDQKSDRRPKGTVLLKDVVPYICIGLMTDRMPKKRPTVPDGRTVHNLVGIGMNPQAEPCHWILFSSDSDIQSWFTEITKTLPKPGNGYDNPQQTPSPGQEPLYNSSSVPIAGNACQRGPPGYTQYPQQAGVSNSTHTTVVVTDGGAGAYGGPEFGFGTGMLAGGLLGYGLGSMWGSHSFGGFGSGFGGGHYSDNDTNITNNYYNNEGGGNTNESNHENNSNANTDNAPITDNTFQEQSDNNYDYGNATYDSGDFGGGDYGGGDFGGGDFGGGGDF